MAKSQLDDAVPATETFQDANIVGYAVFIDEAGSRKEERCEPRTMVGFLVIENIEET